jgi:hypothetical protein
MAVLPPPSQQQLLDDMDELRVKHYEDDWKGRVMFQCLPVHHDAIKNKQPLPIPFPVGFINICDCLGSFNENNRAPQTRGMHRLCLDPSICPNPPSVGDDPCKNKSLTQMKLDLQSAANDSGSPIICNGGGRLARQFQCEHCNKVYSSQSGAARNPEDCRQDALINTDKGGRRNGGQTEAKRVRTAKAGSSDRLCKFGFRLLWGTHGFHVSTLGSGISFHN